MKLPPGKFFLAAAHETGNRTKIIHLIPLLPFHWIFREASIQVGHFLLVQLAL
jgi:hypothetical protein